MQKLITVFIVIFLAAFLFPSFVISNPFLNLLQEWQGAILLTVGLLPVLMLKVAANIAARVVDSHSSFPLPKDRHTLLAKDIKAKTQRHLLAVSPAFVVLLVYVPLRSFIVGTDSLSWQAVATIMPTIILGVGVASMIELAWVIVEEAKSVKV